MGWRFRSSHLRELDSYLAAELLVVQRQRTNLATHPFSLFRFLLFPLRTSSSLNFLDVWHFNNLTWIFHFMSYYFVYRYLINQNRNKLLVLRYSFLIKFNRLCNTENFPLPNYCRRVWTGQLSHTPIWGLHTNVKEINRLKLPYILEVGRVGILTSSF